MNPLQKVIKYLAIAFAVFLCVCIVGGIISLACLFLDKDDVVGEMKTYSVEEEISSLSLKLSGATLTIKVSDSFSVESNHKYLSVTTKSGVLSIKETKKFFRTEKAATVVLNTPENFVFDEATIETGAGRVDVDALSADILKLSLGAGEANIKNLTANARSEIDGGAGQLTIDGGRLCNLDLDMGVGELTLKSRLEGDSHLDYGVGETHLILLGKREDYQIKIDKGIGEAKLEGESMKDGSVYGTGKNKIEIDGGIGGINVAFSDAEDYGQKTY